MGKTSYIRTYSGEMIDILDPTPETINITDIARSLSRNCRFNGHLRDFYSVAQHSVLASFLVPKEHALIALLHDASEQVMGDLPSPVKRLLPKYREIEENLQRVICEKYGLQYPFPECIHEADNVLMRLEKRFLIEDYEDGYHNDTYDMEVPFEIVPQTAKEAREDFIKRFNELYKGKTNA